MIVPVAPLNKPKGTQRFVVNMTFAFVHRKIIFCRPSARLLNDMSEKGLYVFPTHQQVWDHNKIKLLEVNQSYPIAKLSAISKGVHANSMESES
jgi:hypothetical protein